MRRVFSITLLALFLWPSLAVWLLPSAGTDLPVCCRANGKHHCAMLLGRSSDQSQAAMMGERCPAFPNAVVWNNSSFSNAPADQFASEMAFTHTYLVAPAEASYRAAWSRSRQKRGPPAFA